MRQPTALIGGALALALALAGCANNNQQAESNAPTAAAELEPGDQSGGAPSSGVSAATNIPTDAAAPERQPTVSTLPTAVNVPSSGALGGGASFGTATFTRTETITVGADGSLTAGSINVQAGEVFALTLANSGSADVLMRVPLGDAGQIGVLLQAGGLAATGGTMTDSGATTQNGGDVGTTSGGTAPETGATTTGGEAAPTTAATTTGDTGGASGGEAADSTTGGGTTADSNTGAANSAGAANSQGGSTGGPSGGVDTATGGSNDSIITDSAAAVPTIEAGGSANTEGSELGSAAQGSESGAVSESSAGQAASQGMPVTLLMRFDRPGSYTLACEPASDPATGVDGAAAGDVEASGEGSAAATAAPAAETTATAGTTSGEGNSGTTPSTASGGCAGEVTIVVGEAVASTP